MARRNRKSSKTSRQFVSPVKATSRVVPVPLEPDLLASEPTTLVDCARPSPRLRRPLVVIIAMAAIIGLSGVGLAYGSYQLDRHDNASERRIAPPELRRSYTRLNNQINQLENDQVKSGIKVANDDEIKAQLTLISIQLHNAHYSQAKHGTTTLAASVTKWQTELSRRLAITSPTSRAPNGQGADGVLDIPILLYHYTPVDFERQLQVLIERHYNVVNLDQVAAAIAGGASLPAKPAVITFDDGFGDQMRAFSLLQKYNLKATYYIIAGGEASNWCIGAGRRYDQPRPCGDGYLNWDQIRSLDVSGLITIAGHTVDHLNLGSQSPDVQRYQIQTGKAIIEGQIGHPIRHFAYPYGGYNSTTIELVRGAGYTTAVTTLPGTYQTRGQAFVLRRVRDTKTLP